MDKKEGMNRWKSALLLWGGLAAALLWGCFNPIMSAPDQGSENQGSADQGSENPGDSPGPNDGAAGEFTVVLRVGDGGPETGSRSVVGPGAEDIRYVGVWNTVQVIAVDAETQKVKDNQLVKLDNENDSGKTICPNVAQGKRYHFLVLVGHTELNYANKDPEYEYTSDPPTLLAAGFLGDQAINGQATLSVTMKPLVVDTVFKHGGVPVPAVLPDVNGKGVQLPAKVAASVVWTVSGGFDTLLDAQTRTGLPGGINWGGLTLDGKTFIRDGDPLLEPTPVLDGADRNQIVLGLGAPDAGVSGSANFNLTYKPLGEDKGEGTSLWIIRNGINDKAQNKATTFTRDSNGKILWNDLEVSDPKAANGNGAVAFSFEDDIITTIDLTDLLPVPVTGAKPPPGFNEGRYTGEVTWKAAGVQSTTIFEGETVYSATVTLTPKNGFLFTQNPTVTHGGNPVILSLPIDDQKKAEEQVKAEVIFPETGAVWKYGGYFSGSDKVDMDSAIDMMQLAADFSSLSLKLLPWPDDVVDFTKPNTDIGAGLTLTHTGAVNGNSPAAVTIDGGGKTIPLIGGTGSVITVGEGVTLTLRNITFKGLDTNTAPLISVIAGGRLVLEDGAVITGNTNTANNNGAGGVSVAGTGKLVMKGGEISNNKTAATNGGGGVYMAGGVAGGEFTMSGGTISGNETTVANAGGINNSSGTSGGGVSVYGGTFTMSGTAIISDNTTAYYLGDGVYVNGANTKFVMDGGEISGHNRIGVGIDSGGEFTMKGGKIHHNTNLNGNNDRNGGGVRVGKRGAATDTTQRKGTFTMTGGEITENTAKETTYSTSTGVSLGGGGVWLANSPSNANPVKFTMEDGTISKNNGGGVCVGYPVSGSFVVFTMNGGIISGNTNGYGGGVLAMGPFKMTGGTISGNTASGSGGGVYVDTRYGTFTKEPAGGSSTSGVIYGYTAGSALSNWVGTRNADGTPATHTAHKGDVLWEYKSGKYRTATLGDTTSFSNAAGPWADPVTTTNGETIGSFDPFNTGVVDHWYVFDAGATGTYQVQWEDRNDRSSTTSYNADVTVSAYKSDFETSFFTNVDNGYTTPESITLTAGETIHVKVTVKGSYPNYSNGTYLLRFIAP